MTRSDAPPSDRTFLLRLSAAATFLGVATSSAATLTLQSIGRRPSLAEMLVVELPYWLLWAALAPVVARVVRVAPLRAPGLWRHVAIHVGVAAMLFLAHAVVLYLVQRAFGMGISSSFSEGIAIVARWRLVSNVLAYSAIAGVVTAHDATLAARQRERLAAGLSADLARAQLETLRLQLNPHFLFNALNAASMLVRQSQGEQSIRVLAGVSDLLRRVLAHDRAEVTLREELDLLDRYLAIEHVRFGDRLRVARDIDENALDAAIPSLLLQPIVENAIHHGVALNSGASSLVIAAHCRDERLIVEVCNDGTAADEAALAQRGLGIGIRNTVERLARLYGDAFGFDLARTQRGTVATVTLPLRLQSVGG